MTTQDDITIVNDDDEMQFQCRACNARFKVVPRGVADRQRELRTLDQTVRLIVAEHIQSCPVSQPAKSKKK
jgi:hypothetical protein